MASRKSTDAAEVIPQGSKKGCRNGASECVECSRVFDGMVKPAITISFCIDCIKSLLDKTCARRKGSVDAALAKYRCSFCGKGLESEFASARFIRFCQGCFQILLQENSVLNEEKYGQKQKNTRRASPKEEIKEDNKTMKTCGLCESKFTGSTVSSFCPECKSGLLVLLRSAKQTHKAEASNAAKSTNASQPKPCSCQGNAGGQGQASSPEYLYHQDWLNIQDAQHPVGPHPGYSMYNSISTPLYANPAYAQPHQHYPQVYQSMNNLHQMGYYPRW